MDKVNASLLRASHIIEEQIEKLIVSILFVSIIMMIEVYHPLNTIIIWNINK
jgi:hypothetical protein